VQGTIVKYSSGFTEGTVGFSTEVAAYNAWPGPQQAGYQRRFQRTLADSNGDAVGQWSKMGLANVKAASPTPP
jgi:hypothetical protein